MKEIKSWKVILIWFIVPAAVSIISTLFLLLLNPSQDINGVLASFISFLSMLLIILMFGKVNSKLVTERYKDLKCKFNIKEIISVTITQIFLSIGLSNLSIGFMAINDVDKALISLNDTFSNPTTNIELLLCFVTMVILAPVLEEITFRRVLFTGLSKRLNFFMASTISSLLFGFGHDILGVFGAIVFGYSCCILYKKYNNILIPISVHCLNNLLAAVFVCISYFNGTLNIPTEYITNYDIKRYFISGSILTIITLIIFIKFILKNKKYIKNEKIQNLKV
ncbi:type II CAAX endopeptidase family protein [Clostridium sp. D53t1_180928_C8]|uniref:CPBP family intramembrane glutamic endopeptidase n=1 Tax=Clostridium sp. D53t1_180928_C8 TaxID=2787101 RepID=UPI0018AC80BD|nr:type II CAAX endopeptidase family protein [Clostridium sp. D53t1_180928_C8]